VIVDSRAEAAERASTSPAALVPWTVHDLRHTVATGLQPLGVRLEVTEAVLNHVSGSRGGIAGVYQRHDRAAEKRAALDAWADYVLAVVERRELAGNVVVLDREIKELAEVIKVYNNNQGLMTTNIYRTILRLLHSDSVPSPRPNAAKEEREEITAAKKNAMMRLGSGKA
jgi:hypothetical protein